jgi:hypothetical protein
MRSIDGDFSLRFEKAESSLRARLKSLYRDLSDSEKERVQNFDFSSELNATVDTRLNILEHILSFNLHPMDSTTNEMPNNLIHIFMSCLEKAELELEHFDEGLLAPVGPQSCRRCIEESPVRRILREVNVETLRRLREFDFEIGYTAYKFSSLQSSYRNDFVKGNFISSLKTKDSSLQSEISRLRAILQKLSKATYPCESFDEIDEKYLRWLSGLSELIFDLVSKQQHLPKHGMWVFTKVLPMLLARSSTLLEQSTQAVDHYLRENEHERGIKRLIQYELSRVTRSHRK